MDIVYGRNPVLEAMRSGRGVRKLIIAEGIIPDVRIAEIRRLATEREIAIEQSNRQRLNDISHSENHQGVVGYFHSRPVLELPEFLEKLVAPAAVLVLDGIQDPHNLGALIRSADCAGFQGVVIPKHHAATVTPAVVKVSAGASEYLPVISVGNLANALDAMGAHGIELIGLDAGGDTRYTECDYRGSVAVVVGAEGEGLRPSTQRRCHRLVSIPLRGHVSSLNATVAGAVIMYEVLRQRLP